MSKLLYPLFGLIVIGGYAFALNRAIEPFSASTERGEIGAATSTPGASGRSRSPTFIWFGGIGGK